MPPSRRPRPPATTGRRRGLRLHPVGAFFITILTTTGTITVCRKRSRTLAPLGDRRPRSNPITGSGLFISGPSRAYARAFGESSRHSAGSACACTAGRSIPRCGRIRRSGFYGQRLVFVRPLEAVKDPGECSEEVACPWSARDGRVALKGDRRVSDRSRGALKVATIIPRPYLRACATSLMPSAEAERCAASTII